MRFEENGTGPACDGVDAGFLRRIIDDGCCERRMPHRRSMRPSCASTEAMAEHSGTDNDEGSRSCGYPSCLEGFPLGMVYCPCQEFRNIYEPDNGLMHGTIFGELDYPFLGGEKGRGGCRA